MDGAGVEDGMVNRVRAALATTVMTNADCSGPIQQLIELDVPLQHKFLILDFCELLVHNGQSVEGLRRLIMALNILDKYGRHLLKPPEARSNMWRHIKYNNSIFRDRVDTIQGGRKIMLQLGYTVNRADGVAFPDGAEPVESHVLQVVADILLGKKELEAYLGGGHPHPGYIEGFLDPELLDVLKPPSSKATLGPQQRARPTPHPDTRLPADPGRSSEAATPGAATVISGQSPDDRTETVVPADEKNMSVPVLPCDICGANEAFVVCHTCDSKQLCIDCNIKWHKHPKRQKHSTQQLAGTQLAPHDDTPTPGHLAPPAPCAGKALGPAAGSQGQPGSGAPQSPQLATPMYIEAPKEQPEPAYSMQPVLFPPQYSSAGLMYVPSEPTRPQHVNIPNRLPQAPDGGGWRGHFPATSQAPPGSHASSYLPSQSTYSMVPQYRSNHDVRHSMPAYIPPYGPYPQTSVQMYVHPEEAGRYVYGRMISANSQTSGSSGPVLASPNPAASTEGHYSGDYINFSAPQTPAGQDPSYLWNLGSLTSTGAERSESKMLPRIKSMPDLQQRKARLDIDLMTLQNDVEEMDKQINAIILHNPNFFADPAYKRLNQRKRLHLQEIQELAAYSSRLDGGASGNEGPNTRTTHNPPAPNDALHPANADMHGGPAATGVYSPRFQRYSAVPVLAPPPGSMGQAAMMPPPVTSPGLSPGLGALGVDETPVYPPYIAETRSAVTQPAVTRPAVTQPAAQDSQIPDITNVEPSDTENDDRNKRLEDVRRMLVLDQSPFTWEGSEEDNKTELKLNIPVNDLGADRSKENSIGLNDMIAYPPELPTVTTKPGADCSGNSLSSPNTSKMEKSSNSKVSNLAEPSPVSHLTAGKQVQSAPNLEASAHEAGALQKHSSAGDVYQWECEHCTFCNNMGSRVCAMCSKTSDNPQILGALPASTARSDQHSVEDPVAMEQCESCTYSNRVGSKACVACRQVKLAVGSASGLEKLINEEQDQVLMEKKQALAEFQRKNQLAAGFDQPRPDVEVPAGDAAAISGPKGPTKGSSMQSELRVEGSREGEKPGGPCPRSLQHLRKSSDHGPSSESSGSYSTAHNSLDHETGSEVPPADAGMTKCAPVGGLLEGAEVVGDLSPAIGAPATGPAPHATAGERKPVLPSNFAEAIEQINEQRAREQMSLDGHDFISIIKGVEKAGFSVEELEIALDECLEGLMDPLDWLTGTWQQMVETVARNATETGRAAEQNDVGELTVEEARASLLECRGDIGEATHRCVDQRRARYAEISERGLYAREDILAALSQHCGARADALTHLDLDLLQGYGDRLWSSPGPGGEAVMLTLAREAMIAEMNTSVANSVVEHDDFEQVVHNMDVDIERRIRMMFVEAKLKSWGRAETVISILDNEVTGAAEPLECSLKDIVDAVRNCGDKKSSLIFLKQECGLCYGLFPMTKIRNLACCTCKLCMGCVKQNFEVVVRERHVRNWGCPLCEVPNLEDDDAAPGYLELLQLILRSLVDDELMDLYDLRLRDWHLRKDPNFRWCAHCAAGFLWERPNVLAMTCQACRQKTCFMCKKMWEPQHEGITCEEFQQWQINNDPDTQAAGLAHHLQENGIDCPSCKMRYALAKGGCMHFTCPECGHEFCSGCSQPFFKPGVCMLLKNCGGKGLHCHHPRDCFYYLRDNSPQDLQRLLEGKHVEYNTAPPELQADKAHCPVMEQKEHGTQMKDERCGVDTHPGIAGLCENHYKEYLVGLLNRNKIDPVAIMGVAGMKILIQRQDLAVPILQRGENDAQYRQRLLQFIKEKIPLKR